MPSRKKKQTKKNIFLKDSLYKKSTIFKKGSVSHNLSVMRNIVFAQLHPMNPLMPVGVCGSHTVFFSKPDFLLFQLEKPKETHCPRAESCTWAVKSVNQCWRKESSGARCCSIMSNNSSKHAKGKSGNSEDKAED